MKKYETWEAIKMITENSKLKFRQIGEFENNNYIELSNNDGHMVHINAYKSGQCDSDFLNRQWTLVKEPVSFIEAIHAFKEGKTIKSVCNTSSDSYSPDETDYMEITPEEILEGKWYIEY